MTPKEIVLKGYPNAFEYDDGESVTIRLRVKVERTCDLGHKHQVDQSEGLCEIIGKAGNSQDAWRSASRLVE